MSNLWPEVLHKPSGRLHASVRDTLDQGRGQGLAESRAASPVRQLTTGDKEIVFMDRPGCWPGPAWRCSHEPAVAPWPGWYRQMVKNSYFGGKIKGFVRRAPTEILRRLSERK